MAKTYYNQDETLAKLGITEDRLRDMVREGRIREFRDSGKLNYRVDEVDRAAKELGGGSSEDSGELELGGSGEIPLAPLDADDSSGPVLELSDSDAPIDMSSGTDHSGDTDAISLGDSGGMGPLALEDSGAESDPRQGRPASRKVETGPGDSDGTEVSLALEDTGASGGGDLTLEDTDTTPQAEEETSEDIISLDQVDKDAVEEMKKDDTVITNIGISVFDDDDLEIAADPMAKTLMTGGDEHLGLDGSGGGSGLLDLTRESDDTSLGAELLEGIDMDGSGESLAASDSTAAPVGQEEAEELEEPEPEALDTGPMPTLVPAGVGGVVETASPAFTGLLVAAVLVLVLAGAANVAMTMGALPAYLGALSNQFLAFLGGCIGVGGLFGLIGWLVGKQSSRPPSTRAPKAKAEKADKGGKTKKVKAPKAKKEKKPKKEKPPKSAKGKKG